MYFSNLRALKMANHSTSLKSCLLTKTLLKAISSLKLVGIRAVCEHSVTKKASLLPWHCSQVNLLEVSSLNTTYTAILKPAAFG